MPVACNSAVDRNIKLPIFQSAGAELKIDSPYINQVIAPLTRGFYF
jgi:hypothetical protein